MLTQARASQPAQRIIRDAFKELERVVSPLEAKDFHDTTLQNVQKAALDIETKLAARQLLTNMNRLMPLFKGLDHYSRSIEVLCNGTPFLAWIWAPIKLILTVSSDFADAFEIIIQAYHRIGESLTRFEMLSQALANSPPVQETLAIFYSDILTFHRQAYLFVKKSGWQIFFLTSWGRFKRHFDGIISDLKEHENLIDKTASAVNVAETAKMRQDLQQWRQESQERLRKQERDESERQYQAIVGWLKADDTDQQVIFDSIVSEADKYLGPCDWILKTPKLKSWMDDTPRESLCWVEGTPGGGKSVIATQIDAFSRVEKRKAVVARHFCTYSHKSSVQFDQILRSLLLQLIRPNDDLVTHVYESYVLAKEATTVQTLEKLILAIGGAVPPSPTLSATTRIVRIILDGLDECEDEAQIRVARLVKGLISIPHPTPETAVYKILVLSRPSRLLKERLRKNPTISLSNGKVKCYIGDSIHAYARQRLDSLSSRFLQLNMLDSDLQLIARDIASKADGMFIWARLVLDYLSGNIFVDRDEVMEAVDTLPKELGKFYGRILSPIAKELNTKSTDRLQYLLGWIALAKQPLSRIEFRSAFAFKYGKPDAEVMPPDYIYEMVVPLVKENTDGTLSFIHVSVRDYLKSPESEISIKECDIVKEQGAVAITCLISGFNTLTPESVPARRNFRMVKGFHGLHLYATEYWLEYLLSAAALSPEGLEEGSALHTAARLLADKLANKPASSSSVSATSSSSSSSSSLEHSDARLELLRNHGEIYEMAKQALMERSMKPINDGHSDVKGKGVIRNDGELVVPTNLKDLLRNYQSTIQSLLACKSLPNISQKDLDLFKKEYRTSAFTCHVPSCPRATIGFPDEKTQLEHEASHWQRIECDVQGCHYPPFVSVQALKQHAIKVHNQGRRPKATRIGQPQNDKDTGNQTQTQSHNQNQIQTTVGMPGPSRIEHLRSEDDRLPDLTFSDSESVEMIMRPPSLNSTQMDLYNGMAELEQLEQLEQMEQMNHGTRCDPLGSATNEMQPRSLTPLTGPSHTQAGYYARPTNVANMSERDQKIEIDKISAHLYEQVPETIRSQLTQRANASREQYLQGPEEAHPYLYYVMGVAYLHRYASLPDRFLIKGNMTPSVEEKLREELALLAWRIVRNGQSS